MNNLLHLAKCEVEKHRNNNMPKVSLFLPKILLILLSSCYIIPCLCCPEYQKQALLQFKSLLLGNNSYNSSDTDLSGLESWNSSFDCCRWERVDCDSNTSLKQVTHLYLEAFTPNIPFLKGTVVKSNILTPLFHLQTVELLDISGNDIQGEILGAELANLTKLVELDMGGNFFSMEIPTDIGNLSRVWHLSLRDNHFWGEIPPSIQKMEQLYTLDLSNNSLSGAVPEWLGKMNIKELNLSNNMLTGSLPSYLFQSPKLTVLDLTRNNLSGKLPDNIGEAIELRVLFLSDNKLFGPIPKSFLNMSVTSLDLSRNNFSGDLSPICGSNFNSIRYAQLSHNEFSGVLPQNLKNCSLILLDLHDNYLTGEILQFFSENSLLFLNLRNNFFHDSIPDFWSYFSNLQILDLSNNNFNGKIPPSLGQLRGMENASCPFPKFSLYSRCRKIVNLDPSQRITERAKDPNKVADLSSEFQVIQAYLKSLALEVFWKKSAVELPTQNIMLYTFLDLSNNQLSGEIPNNLGRLEDLKSLNISYNKLCGKIPMTLGDLKNVEILDLSHNSLTGEIPQTFQNLLQLTNLDLSNNKLTGRIPNGPQMNTFNDPSSYANNSGLCGMQIQVPCEKEPPKTNPAETKPSEKETWFSWKMAGIGFPTGFFSTISVLFISGYFHVAA